MVGTAEMKASAADAGMPAAEANSEGKLGAVRTLIAWVLEALFLCVSFDRSCLGNDETTYKLSSSLMMLE